MVETEVEHARRRAVASVGIHSCNVDLPRDLIGFDRNPSDYKLAGQSQIHLLKQLVVAVCMKNEKLAVGLGKSAQVASVAVGSTHRKHVDVAVDGIFHIHEVNASLGVVDPHHLRCQFITLTIEAMDRNLNLLAQAHIGKANQGEALLGGIPGNREVAFSNVLGRHLQEFL